MKIRPRRSSPMSSSIFASRSPSCRARSTSRPISSCLRRSAWRRRIASIAPCFAVHISQAPGRSGIPEAGHCSSAATRASCASSSAVPMSPTTRTSPAISRADSIRQIASIARYASVAIPPTFRGPSARAPSHALVHWNLANLEGPAVVGRALEPLEGLVDRPNVPEPVSGDELLGLRERPIADRALLALEPDPFALRARGKASGPNDHARLDQLFVELLVLRHRFRCRGRRRLALLAFLGEDQYTHLLLLLRVLGTSDRHPCVGL